MVWVKASIGFLDIFLTQVNSSSQTHLVKLDLTPIPLWKGQVCRLYVGSSKKTYIWEGKGAGVIEHWWNHQHSHCNGLTSVRIPHLAVKGKHCKHLVLSVLSHYLSNKWNPFSQFSPSIFWNKANNCKGKNLFSVYTGMCKPQFSKQSCGLCFQLLR